MAKWETEFFRGNIGETVKCEYRKLLSVNKTGEEAEALLTNYFKCLIDTDALSAGLFWMAIGLREWQFGRLTQNAKELARKWALHPWDNISILALESLLTTLDMPMPPAKKIRPPSYISRCPWPVGSLLAYRIISSEHPHVTQSPFYGKYVLLRIIKIKRNPITHLAPEAGWNERMLVGLYDWISDSIPDPEITNNLQFTAISVQEPKLHMSAFQSIQTDERCQHIIEGLTSKRIETCCDLDWKCIKGISAKDVFT